MVLLSLQREHGLPFVPTYDIKADVSKRRERS